MSYEMIIQGVELVISISVIIPYYNEDREIFSQCINSVLSQTFGSYEIIIIDDGSDEHNKAFLDQVKGIDKRIRIISQQNKGVSSARNRGIDNALGKYLVFVDADDLIVPYYFEEAFNYAENYNADILYSFVIKTKNASIRLDRNASPKINRIDDEWLEKYTIGYWYTNGDKCFGRGPWARFVKTEIAKQTPFVNGVPIGEDVLWNLDIMRASYNKYLVDQIWYKYMVRCKSVTRRYDPNIEEKLLPFYAYIENYILRISSDLKKKKEYYYARLYRDYRRYIYKIYLGNSGCDKSFVKKWCDFNRISKKYPWSRLGSYEHFKIANIKTKIQIIMIRMGLVFPYWRLKSIYCMLKKRD